MVSFMFLDDFAAHTIYVNYAWFNCLKFVTNHDYNQSLFSPYEKPHQIRSESIFFSNVQSVVHDREYRVVELL